jgi:hypothetical protein
MTRVAATLLPNMTMKLTVACGARSLLEFR